MRILTEDMVVSTTKTSLPELSFLHLEGRDVEKLTECFEQCSALVSLNLRSNRLGGSLISLRRCTELWFVDLSYNSMGSLEGLQYLSALGYLDLSYNHLPVDELKKLGQVAIVQLSLRGNQQLERVLAPSYRTGVLKHVSSPWVLDGDFVRAEERAIAKDQLQNATGSESVYGGDEACLPPFYKWDGGESSEHGGSSNNNNLSIGTLAQRHLETLKDQPSAVSHAQDCFRLKRLGRFLDDDAKLFNGYIKRMLTNGPRPKRRPLLHLDELRTQLHHEQIGKRSNGGNGKGSGGGGVGGGADEERVDDDDDGGGGDRFDARAVRLDLLVLLTSSLLWPSVPKLVLFEALTVLLGPHVAPSAVIKDLSDLPPFAQSSLCFALRCDLLQEVSAVPEGPNALKPHLIELLKALPEVASKPIATTHAPSSSSSLSPPSIPSAGTTTPAAAAAASNQEHGGEGTATSGAADAAAAASSLSSPPPLPKDNNNNSSSNPEAVARRASILISRAPSCPALTSAVHTSASAQKVYSALGPLLQCAGFSATDLMLSDEGRSDDGDGDDVSEVAYPGTNNELFGGMSGLGDADNADGGIGVGGGGVLPLCPSSSSSTSSASHEEESSTVHTGAADSIAADSNMLPNYSDLVAEHLDGVSSSIEKQRQQQQQQQQKNDTPRTAIRRILHQQQRQQRQGSNGGNSAAAYLSYNETQDMVEGNLLNARIPKPGERVRLRPPTTTAAAPISPLRSSPNGQQQGHSWAENLFGTSSASTSSHMGEGGGGAGGGGSGGGVENMATVADVSLDGSRFTCFEQPASGAGVGTIISSSNSGGGGGGGEGQGSPPAAAAAASGGSKRKNSVNKRRGSRGGNIKTPNTNTTAASNPLILFRRDVFWDPRGWWVHAGSLSRPGSPSSLSVSSAMATVGVPAPLGPAPPHARAEDHLAAQDAAARAAGGGGGIGGGVGGDGLIPIVSQIGHAPHARLFRPPSTYHQSGVQASHGVPNLTAPVVVTSAPSSRQGRGGGGAVVDVFSADAAWDAAFVVAPPAAVAMQNHLLLASSAGGGGGKGRNKTPSMSAAAATATASLGWTPIEVPPALVQGVGRVQRPQDVPYSLAPRQSVAAKLSSSLFAAAASSSSGGLDARPAPPPAANALLYRGGGGGGGGGGLGMGGGASLSSMFSHASSSSSSTLVDPHALASEWEQLQKEMGTMLEGSQGRPAWRRSSVNRSSMNNNNSNMALVGGGGIVGGDSLGSPSNASSSSLASGGGDVLPPLIDVAALRMELQARRQQQGQQQQGHEQLQQGQQQQQQPQHGRQFEDGQSLLRKEPDLRRGEEEEDGGTGVFNLTSLGAGSSDDPKNGNGGGSDGGGGWCIDGGVMWSGIDGVVSGDGGGGGDGNDGVGHGNVAQGAVEGSTDDDLLAGRLAMLRQTLMEEMEVEAAGALRVHKARVRPWRTIGSSKPTFIVAEGGMESKHNKSNNNEEEGGGRKEGGGDDDRRIISTPLSPHPKEATEKATVVSVPLKSTALVPAVKSNVFAGGHRRARHQVPAGYVLKPLSLSKKQQQQSSQQQQQQPQESQQPQGSRQRGEEMQDGDAVMDEEDGDKGKKAEEEEEEERALKLERAQKELKEREVLLQSRLVRAIRRRGDVGKHKEPLKYPVPKYA